MREYNKVGSRLHSSRRFQQLSDAGKLAYYYLLTTRHLNSIGLYELSTGYLAVDYSWTETKASAALAEVEDSGLIDLYEPECLVRIDKHFDHNPITNAKHAAGAVKLVMMVPDCPLRDRVIAELRVSPHVTNDMRRKMPDIPMGTIGLSESYDRAIHESGADETAKATSNIQKQSTAKKTAENSGARYPSDTPIKGLSTTETETETETETKKAQYARENSAAFELTRRLETVLGKKLKSQASIIRTWQALGITDDAIVAIVHERFNKWKSNNPGESITSLRYFENAVIETSRKARAKPTGQPLKLEDIDLDRSVRLYREYLDAGCKPEFKRWHHEKLTPAPGQPGCKVPAEILERHQFDAIPTKPTKKPNRQPTVTTPRPPDTLKGKPTPQGTGKTETRVTDA